MLCGCFFFLVIRQHPRLCGRYSHAKVVIGTHQPPSPPSHARARARRQSEAKLITTSARDSTNLNTIPPIHYVPFRGVLAWLGLCVMLQHGSGVVYASQPTFLHSGHGWTKHDGRHGVFVVVGGPEAGVFAPPGRRGSRGGRQAAGGVGRRGQPAAVPWSVRPLFEGAVCFLLVCLFWWCDVIMLGTMRWLLP